MYLDVDNMLRGLTFYHKCPNLFFLGYSKNGGIFQRLDNKTIAFWGLKTFGWNYDFCMEFFQHDFIQLLQLLQNKAITLGPNNNVNNETIFITCQNKLCYQMNKNSHCACHILYNQRTLKHKHLPFFFFNLNVSW